MLKTLSAALTAIVLTTGAGVAAEVKDSNVILQEVVRGTTLAFEPVKWPADAHGVTMTVVGPGEYEAMQEYGKSVPVMILEKYGDLKDGVYSYQITGGTSVRVKTPEVFNNGREKKTEFSFQTFSVAGRIVIDRGRIVDFQQGVEKGSEETVPGKDVKDNDEGYKPTEGEGKGEPSNDSDKG